MKTINNDKFHGSENKLIKTYINSSPCLNYTDSKSHTKISVTILTIENRNITILINNKFNFVLME